MEAVNLCEIGGRVDGRVGSVNEDIRLCRRSSSLSSDLGLKRFCRLDKPA